MSKINYKIDAENENFYIMENPKTTGIAERRFPRMYQCVPLSNDGFKIISLENQLQIYTGKISDHTIDGVEFTDVFEFCKALAEVIYTGAGASSLGKDCENSLKSTICNVDEITEPIVAAIDALKEQNTLNSEAEQAILNGILLKLDVLIEIKDAIEAFAEQNNLNLTNLLDRLEDLILKIEAGNLTLVEIKDLISISNTLLADIKLSLDEFKDLFDEKITSVLEKLDVLHADFVAVSNLLQTEFDETQEKLDELIAASKFGQDTFQVQDCAGNLVGTPEEVNKVIVLNKQTVSICNIDELADAINAGAKDYTDLLTSIDTKLDTLEDIKTELVTANTTLTGIKEDTATINENLETLIEKADIQITALADIKNLLNEGNTSLAELVTLTTTIDANITTIKEDVALIKADISEIKGDVKLAVEALNNIETLIEESNTLLTDILAELDIELVYTSATQLNNGTANFYSREKVLWDSETSAEISRVVEFSSDGKTWSTTEPSGTLEIGWINTAFILGEEVLNCGVKTDGTKEEYYIRQDYLGTELLPLKYSQNRIDWSEDAPADTTFALGACPVEIIEPVCIENVSYDLDGAKGIIFEASKLNSYNAFVYRGEMKYTEKNSVGIVEESYEHSNGLNQDDRLLPNELKIVNRNANSRTIIKVLQVCGYMPIIADVIDETMVLLVSAEPKADNTAIDVKFTDVPPDGSTGATGYRIKRYVKGQPLTTALTLIDWTEGASNALITNNGDGTYTYKDATAVVDTDYMYFYEAYNVVSEGTSNELEASLFATSFEPVMRTTTANELVTLPMTTTSPVVIDWGDGTTTTQSAPFTKTYATAGDYHIKVKITASREVTNFRFNNAGDRLKLIDIKNWGWVKLTGGNNFFGCANLEKITAEDTPSGLINMSGFFANCSKLNQIDNFNWDTSLVTTMSSMLSQAKLFNLPINHLDTSNVTNMSSLLNGAESFNQSVNQLDTSKVTTMQSMFADAIKFNQPVPFNTEKVITMSTMFFGAKEFNQPVLFNIPLLTNATMMFQGATAFSTTNMDNVLIHFASQTTLNNVPMNNNRPRTSASNSAVATLQGRGWTGL
jgi:surface protein